MIKKFATVTLWVEDFKNALHFYRDVLGLELISQPGDMPHFKVGEGLLVLAKGRLQPPANAFPPDFPLLSLEVVDLDTCVTRLHSFKFALECNIEERRDSRWIKLHNPDGNLIELVELKS